MKDVGHITKAFEDADTDKNGKIEWTEFLEFTKAMKAGGKVKPKEKKKISKKTSKLTNEMRREILRMFHSMDPNGNGFVDGKEFEDYMLNNNIALSHQRIR